MFASNRKTKLWSPWERDNLRAMSSTDDRAELAEIEQLRLRALVDSNVALARELHADDFQLVTPNGDAYTKDEYLSSIGSGAIGYRLWEPLDIDVRVSGDAGCLRYHSNLDIVVAGHRTGPRSYWHTDYYERRDGRWQVIWSHATEIVSAREPP